MREPPPSQLRELLQRLGPASDRDLESVEPIVRRLAGDLPQFQSVWIDALRQSRLLSHYQAAEIQADRGNSLRLGQYVLRDLVQECGFAAVFKADDIESGEAFRLARFPIDETDPDRIFDRLVTLVAAAKRLPQLSGLIENVGRQGSQAWAVSRWVDGTSLDQWMLHHGRFQPEIVLEIARAMVRDLAAMEASGLIHGDIRIENVLLLSDGGICLPMPGLRGIIRPQEGIAHGNLMPEACGALAPERVAAGSPPTVASDLFACGCVWWQMLCGWPPLGGGNTLSRLRAAQAAAIEDFRQWANDVPRPLAEALTACLQKDPRERPATIASLAGQLGPLRRSGRQAIVRCLQTAGRPRAPWLASKRAKENKAHPHLWTAATLTMLTVVAIAWPLWVAMNRPHAIANIEHRQDVALRHDLITRPNENPRTGITRDNAVLQAGFSETMAKPQATYRPTGSGGTELLLPGNSTIRAEGLQLPPGIVVRPASGRVRVSVPAGGLSVRSDRVTFENIDFIPEVAVTIDSDSDRRKSALVRVLCPECNFIGCSFQSASGCPVLSSAIDWEHGDEELSTANSLPSGRIRVNDCVFRRVAAGIDSSSRGANSLEIVNSLHLGPGPLIRLSHRPAADEPARIALSQVTLREAESLVEARFPDGAEAASESCGEICIEATGCVFAPRDDAALLVFVGDASPTRLLREMKWTGQGSVVTPKIAFARCRHRDGTASEVDDSTISISGLVHGQVEFAGHFDNNPGSSRILDCQAPLTDSDSTGANTVHLPPDVGDGFDRQR